jgi:chromosome partitioning protein
MTQKIAILNQKGGVGKTTTAINTAAYLQKLGKSVLIVDLDPQGNATSGLGITKANQEVTTYELLLGEAPLEKAIIESESGLLVIPANATLAAAEVELVSTNQREMQLRHVLQTAAYDYILIDCPPSLGLLSINALTAAEWLLIPVQAEYYALEGLSQLLDVVQRIRGSLNPDLELLGVVVTMFDGRTTLSENVYSELKKHFGNKLFETVVPRNVRLAEAPSYGKSIADHDKWSKGARAYKQLAKAVNKRVEG